MAEGFLIGGTLLTRIKTTIDRVGDMPMAMGSGRIPTVVRGPMADAAIRIGTFSGAWSKGSDKTVTFKYQTNTPNTVTATNLFAEVAGSGTKNCAIAKEGTAWFLVASEC